jgi:hypothetical protein
MNQQTKEAALAEIEQLKKQIEELQARINATASEELPAPLATPLQDGEKYFAASIRLNRAVVLTWNGLEFDHGFLQAGLLFPHTDLGRKAAEERAKRGLVKLYEAAEPLMEKPEHGQIYYLWDNDYEFVSYSTWEDDGLDKTRFKQGSVFPLTTEGAIGASEYGKNK